ncbi:FCD domain-containing protein [Rouxiella badensis]|nr:FCD domain-containing protein [Rouxiella badensis]
MADETPSPQEDWEIDSRLHNALAHYSGNQLLTQYIESLRLKTRMFNLRQVPERFVSGHHEHLEIIAALRSGDADGARAAAARHIDNVRESIVRRLSQL